MTLGEIIKRNARRFPNDLALLFKDNCFTFAEFNQRTNCLANGLIDNGARKGDRVCVILDNCHQHLEIAGAAWKAGLVACPLGTHLKGELDHIIGNAKPSIIIVGENHVKKINPSWSSIKNIICLGDAHVNTTSYEELIATSAADDPGVDVDEHDMSMIYYTSGTTGNPKGVSYSHIGQIKHAEDQNLSMGISYYQERKAMIIHPLYFNAPMNCTFIPNMLMGNTIVILESFSPKSFLETVEREKIDEVVLVPTMIFRLLEYPDLEKYDYSSLKMLGYGSAPMPVAVLRKGIKIFGKIFFQGYGLTECTGTCCYLPIEDHMTDGSEKVHRRLASCGREKANCWMRVVREDGSDIDCDMEEVGEIILKCEYLMKGYFNMPEETAKAIKDGWLYTGDMAALDEDGYFYIRDRKSDMIISGGINIYPWEIENVLFSHPAVSEAAVIGKPDPEWGEIIKAFVVLKSGQKITEEEIISFCNDKLATYKKPKEISFVGSLPHGSTGKVSRRELKMNEIAS